MTTTTTISTTTTIRPTGSDAPDSRVDDGDNTTTPTTHDENEGFQTGRWLFRFTVVVLLVDLVVSILIMSPLFSWVRVHEDSEYQGQFVFSKSLKDLLLLCWLRVAASSLAFFFSFLTGKVRPEYPFDVHHPNGTKKSQEQLDEELLEQPFRVWFGNYLHRAAFPSEFFALCTAIVCVVKSLVRLNVEIGILRDAEPLHPLFWISILFASIISLVEYSCTDRVTVRLSAWGEKYRKNEQGGGTRSLLRQISSQLSLPLLANDSLHNNDTSGDSDTNDNDDEEGRQSEDDENQAGVSDLGDSNYKASWTDLIQLCAPDTGLIFVASVFLVLAAAAQIYIPYFTGAILDALERAYSDNEDDDGDHGGSITDVPGFTSNVKKLIVVSVLGGVFSGVRGSIFTIVGGRVNVRMRLRLMDSLLTQDQGFYDVTKTGDITSRLSSDTTLVGDQVTLNVNVFLRSIVQIIGVLMFMFRVSWQLSILAFISVPVITILSKVYGSFVRSLTKVMQTKLAEGNSISDQAISNYSTVRGFDGQQMEYNEFSKKMNEYLALTMKAAVAYSGYAMVATSLPQLVTALVVFYGGFMVRNGDITSGALVSFLLYLSSLSDSFASVGYIFSSLTMAVGAADKVFELMHRTPKRRPPRSSSSSHSSRRQNTTSLIEKNRSEGIEPDVCRGEIELRDVELHYPARPQRRVLNGMSMVVPPGKIVALVGASGGGKSSVISLIQNLYQPSGGKVMIDGVDVHDLSPKWLARHVSQVQQEPTLFARSIKRNIIYGLEGTDREPSQEDIEHAAKMASCDEFIQKLPMKYDTEVGERGVQLSGGQKQRIAISRALIRKPKILLLDEATSALDAESEHQVQAAIDHMIESARSAEGGNNNGSGSAGMSVMIVAHRLSTIRSADIIFVVQDGRVIEQGSHSELITKDGGAYSALVRRQMNVQSKLEGNNAVGADDRNEK